MVYLYKCTFPVKENSPKMYDQHKYYDLQNCIVKQNCVQRENQEKPASLKQGRFKLAAVQSIDAGTRPCSCLQFLTPGRTMLCCVSQFCLAFGGHFLPRPWFGRFSTPGLRIGRGLDSLPLSLVAGIRGYAILPPTSTTITICSTATTYTSNHAHNCINIFLQVEEMIRKCEILAFVVYERSRGSFWLATASALLLLAETPNHQIPTPLSQQLSSTIWVKRGFSWKKVPIFLQNQLSVHFNLKIWEVIKMPTTNIL